jgi:TonB family protein
LTAPQKPRQRCGQSITFFAVIIPTWDFKNNIAGDYTRQCPPTKEEIKICKVLIPVGHIDVELSDFNPGSYSRTPGGKLRAAALPSYNAAMPLRSWMRALLAASVLIAAATAQELKQASMEEATKHLTKRVEPRYPSTAEMAHIQGDVVVRVTIDENGKVTDAKPVSGHPMLLEAAVRAVRQWRFEPFLEDGKAIPVNTLVKVGFSLGPGAELRRDYLQSEVECTKFIESNQFAQADKACKKALGIAIKLPKSFESDKMRAYGSAGTAAYGLKKPSEALDDFKQPLNFAQQALQTGNPLMIQVRGNLAHAYVATGQLQEADAAYTETEKAQDAAAQELESRRDKLKPEAYKGVKASYDHNMLVILQEHVAVLRKLGKGPEARELEQRASALSESR